MAPALLWFRGEPPFAHHPPTPHPGIAHFGIGRKRGMWQVSEGGGRAREAAGAAWGPGGPRRSQRRCRNEMPPPPGPGLPAPPSVGRGVGAGGVPWATMALGCIVVKASQVLQGCLVAELVLVLRGGNGAQWGAPAPTPPRALQGLGRPPSSGWPVPPDALPSLSAPRPRTSWKTWLLSCPPPAPAGRASVALALSLQKSLGTLLRCPA